MKKSTLVIWLLAIIFVSGFAWFSDTMKTI